MNIFESPVIVALVVTIFPLALGYLGYRQSQKVDAIAAQAGIATVESGTISQVIDGLNKLVGNLQQDNAVLRSISSEMHARVIECQAELTVVIKKCEHLEAQLAEINARIP